MTARWLVLAVILAFQAAGFWCLSHGLHVAALMLALMTFALAPFAPYKGTAKLPTTKGGNG